MFTFKSRAVKDPVLELHIHPVGKIDPPLTNCFHSGKVVMSL